MANKLPSFRFYPGDWMKDPALRSVGLEARGLWIDMLCLMFECGRRGYLEHATGKPVTSAQLARMTGCAPELVSRLLQELEDSGVFSRNSHGVIYSRRLVEDEHIRTVRSQAGATGGRTTWRLLKQNVKQNASKTEAKRARAVRTAPTGPSPPASSLPRTPSLTPPSAPFFPAAAPPVQGAADGATRTTGTGRQQKPKSQRKVTDEQQAAFTEFADWYRCVAWPKHHFGEEYGFEGADAAAVWACLRHPAIRWDVEKLKRIAEIYVSEPEIYNLHGHPLVKLRARLNYLAGKLAQWKKEGANRVIGLANTSPGGGPRGTRRTGHAGDDGTYATDVPVPVRRLPGQQPGGGSGGSGPAGGLGAPVDGRVLSFQPFDRGSASDQAVERLAAG